MPCVTFSQLDEADPEDKRRGRDKDSERGTDATDVETERQDLGKRDHVEGKQVAEKKSMMNSNRQIWFCDIK